MMRIVIVLSTAILLAVPMSASSKEPAGNQRHRTLLARGKYLVENLGMCRDCHSPRNEKGEFISGRHLAGAPLDFQPLHPVPNWAPAAPPIAGLPGWSTAEAIRFFMTGVAKDGKPASPPMPQYRMSRQDAEAVAAYLKSLRMAMK